MMYINSLIIQPQKIQTLISASKIQFLVQFEEICVEPLTKSAAIKCVASKIAPFKAILSSKSCGMTDNFFLLKMLQDWRNLNWLKYVGLVKMMYIKSLTIQPQKIQTLLSSSKIQFLVQFEEICVEPLTKSAAIKCVASKIASFKAILSSKSCGTTDNFFLLKMLQDWRNMNWLKYVGLVKMI